MSNRPLTKTEWLASLEELWEAAQQPRPWVGLDEEEIRKLYGKDLKYRDGDYMRYAKSVEAKLKERNT
jgi:ABC-type phosphate transport system auxiliary subunit